MPRRKAAQTEVALAGTDDYPEKTDDQMDEEFVVVVEARLPDQIADYHERNPRTVNDGPENDPEVKAQLVAELLGYPQPTQVIEEVGGTE